MPLPVTDATSKPTARFLFSKKFGIGVPAKILGEKFLGKLRARVRFCSTPPPFRADERYPGGPSRGADFPGAAFSARNRSLGRSIGGWLPVSCLGLPHSCHI